MIVWAVLHPRSEPGAPAVSIAPVLPLGGAAAGPRVFGLAVGGAL
jgi:hypothetical protein